MSVSEVSVLGMFPSTDENSGKRLEATRNVKRSPSGVLCS